LADLVVRGGEVVTPEAIVRADVAIEADRIVAIGPELRGTVCEIDARGLHVFPGLIDAHLHFNEPGRAEWEGAATGSRALAAGGGTLFFDMPLNSTPCTVNARAFDRKCEALKAASITDFALWGGLVPGSVGEMAELAARGVVGFKAFMCDSGLPEFPRADDSTLAEGLREASRLKLPVAVHAESQELVQRLSRECAEHGRDSIRDFLAARPVLAEAEAIRRAAQLAGEAGAALHIVHVSSGRGVAVAAEALARGVDVSVETCPHYLFFTEDDVERLGAIAKCAPPLRERAEQESLWKHVLGGSVDLIASDHSPSVPEMKSGRFWQAWGGIAGVQSTLAVLLDQGHQRRGLPLQSVASLIAAGPARRFRLDARGRLAVGCSADLTLVDLSASFTLRPEALLQRHRTSPYLGNSFQGVVRRTIRRGETIYADGAVTAATCGMLVRPRRT